MGGTLTMTGIEVRKLLAQRGFLVISIVLLVVWKLIVLLEIRAGGIADGLDDLRVNGFYLVARSAGYGLVVWMLLLYVLATQSIAGEGERGQLRMLLPRPIARGSIYLGKLAVLLVATTFATVVDAALAGAIGGAFLGFEDVADITLQGPAYSASSLTASLALAYLVTNLAVFATSSVALCVSALFRQATTATSVSLLVLVTIGAVGFVFGEPLDRWLVTTYDTSAFASVEKLTAGTSVYREPGETAWAVLVPLGTVVVTAAIGMLAFGRRDVTT